MMYVLHIRKKNLISNYLQLQQNVFKHPGGHECLPKEVIQHIKEWRRPSEMFGVDGNSIQSKDDKNDLQNLLTINEPLMHVEVITTLCSYFNFKLGIKHLI